MSDRMVTGREGYEWTRRQPRWRLPAWLALALLLGGLIATGADGQTAREDAPRHRQVLLLHSYNQGYAWTDGITDGVRSVFADDPTVILRIEYMDTKVYLDDAWYARLVEDYRYKYADAQPDIVLTADDNAFTFALEHRDTLFPGVPVVFCGVNNLDPARLVGVDGVTGVVEQIDYKTCLEIALHFHPDTTRVLAVSDRTTSGQRNLEVFLEQTEPLADRCTIEWIDEGSFEEIAARVRSLQPGTLIFYLALFRDGDGTPCTLEEGLAMLTEAASVPIYGPWDFLVGKGPVGGFVTSSVEQGRLAATMATRILSGEAVDALPVVDESPNIYLFDYAALTRWGVDPALIPEGARLTNVPNDFYTRNAAWIWGGAIFVVLQSVLIILLLLNRRRRIRAEAILLEREQQYRLLAENSSDVIWRIDATGTMTYVSPAVQTLRGMTPQQVMAEPLDASMTPDSLAALHSATGTSDLPGLLAHGATHPVRAELEMYRADGSTVWVELHTTPVTTNGQAGLVGVTRDMTQRRAAREQLAASEARQRALLTNATDMIAMHDEDGVFSEVSPVCQSLLGFDPEALRGESAYAFIHPADRPAVRIVHDQLQNDGDNGTATYRMRHADGHYVHVESTGRMLVDNAGKREIITVTRDITIRRLSASLIEADRDLHAKLSLAESPHEAYSAFLGTAMRLADAEAGVISLLTGPSDWQLCDVFGLEQDEQAYLRSLPTDGALLSNLAQGQFQTGVWPLPQDAPQQPRELPTRRLTAIPIQDHGKVRAALLLLNPLAAGIPDTILEGLETMASHVGLVMSRLNMDQALRDSEERLALALSSAHIGLCDWDITQDTIVFDRNWYAITERVPMKTGMRPTRLVEITHPDDRDGLRDLLQGVRGGAGETLELELRLLSSKNTWRWFLMRGRIVDWHSMGGPARFIGAFLDNSERKQADEAVRVSEENYRLIAENSSDMITRHRDHRLTYVSPACKRMFGYTPEQLVGTDDQFYVHPDDIDALVSAMESLRDGPNPGQGIWHLYRLRHRLGHYVWVESAIRYMRGVDGRQDEIVAVSRDITERRLADEQRKEMDRRLLEAQKLESLAVLAGGIAHDYNNLLMSIMGNAEMLLLESTSESPYREPVKQIESAARRATELTKQMLAYTGHGKLEMTRVRLNVIVEEMTHLLEASFSRKAKLRYLLDPSLPAVLADAPQVRQVVMNLILNATESLEDSEGTVTIRTDTVELDEAQAAHYHPIPLEGPGTYQVLSVIDTGCGMDEYTLSRMFDPFFTTKFTGRGLGMAAVLGIVRAHHGAIRVDSRPGEGTTVALLLPVADATSSTLPGPEPAVEEDWRHEGAILVVDDEEQIRQLVRGMLERMGYTVYIAHNGSEALAMVRQFPPNLKAILLDLTMPVMDGVDTLEGLRAKGCHLPVILCSGYSKEEVTDRLRTAAPAGFMQKPYRFSELSTVLRGVLRDNVRPNPSSATRITKSPSE